MKANQPDRSKLAAIHTALRTENSFPFHRFGTAKEFAKWKTGLPDQGQTFESEQIDAEVEALENTVEVANVINSSEAAISRKVGDTTIQLYSARSHSAV
jgi:hypothetical protein